MYVRTGIIAAAVTLALAGAAPVEKPVHFGLRSSTPEAGATVPAPEEIQLVFTEVPQDGSVRIRVLEAEDAGVHVMPAVPDPVNAQSFSIVLHGALAPATYTVSWRGMSRDGHVVRDTFEFTVAAR